MLVLAKTTGESEGSPGKTGTILWPDIFIRDDGRVVISPSAEVRVLGNGVHVSLEDLRDGVLIAIPDHLIEIPEECRPTRRAPRVPRVEEDSPFARPTGVHSHTGGETTIRRFVPRGR